MKKMKAQALGYWVKIIIGILLGLLVFTFFVRGITYALHSKCWRDTLNELKPLVESASMNQQPPLLGGADKFYLPVTIRDCLRKIEFTGSDGYGKCRELCTKFFNEGNLKEKCLENCEECKNRNGCIIAVSKRPSYWNYLLPTRIPETYLRRASDTITAFGTDYRFDCAFGGCVFEGKRSEIYCLEFERREDYYYITKTKIESKSECQNY
jgi:hypothetical protein